MNMWLLQIKSMISSIIIMMVADVFAGGQGNGVACTEKMPPVKRKTCQADLNRVYRFQYTRL